jgi:hypothetical protein
LLIAWQPASTLILTFSLAIKRAGEGLIFCENAQKESNKKTTVVKLVFMAVKKAKKWLYLEVSKL